MSKYRNTIDDKKKLSALNNKLNINDIVNNSVDQVVKCNSNKTPLIKQSRKTA